MSRIRTIKPEFWTSEQVVECSLPARLLFIGIWNFADDRGVIPASAKQLKMQIFPGDDFTTAHVQALVNELLAQSLLAEFEHEGRRYWYVTGWNHQKIDKPNPKYPPPPKFDEQSATVRRTFGEESLAEGKGKEGRFRKGEEGKGEERTPSRVMDPSQEPAPSEVPSALPTSPVASDTAASTPKPKARAEKPPAKSTPIWEAYAQAFKARHRVTPVRNGQISAQLCRFADLVGAHDAPAIAAYYVSLNKKFYVENDHPVWCLMRDYQSIRKQWLTGRSTTATYAHNLDQRQETVNMTERLLEKFRREGKLTEESSHAH